MRTAMKAVVRKKIALTVFAAAFVFAACAEEAQIEIDNPNLSSTASVAAVSSASSASSVSSAVSSANEYIVIYNGNGAAAGSMASQTHTIGSEQSLAANAYTHAGYTFDGWNTEANGTGTSYTDGQSVSDLRSTPGSVTLYAQWTLITYTAIYDKNADDALGTMEPSTHTYAAQNLTANTFTREGYIFTGWNTAANGSGTAYADGASTTLSGTGNVTLYAQWRAGMESTLPGSAGTLTMVSIPAGTFTMGSPETEPERSSSETQHSVTLTKGFYMGQYEVTQEQYQAVMTGNANGLSASPSYFTGSPASGEVQEKRPVECVSWYDVLVFCNRLSMLVGLTPVYSINGSTDPANWGAGNNMAWSAVEANWNANGYRLPTEAEWEYACRAGTTTAYSFGASINGDYAWYSGNSRSITHEVGKKLPNAWGLYDMHGNVWELCWDWDGYYASSAVTDPKGPASGTHRMAHGGGWYDDAAGLRSACRVHRPPDFRSGDLGFRLACAVP